MVRCTLARGNFGNLKECLELRVKELKINEFFLLRKIKQNLLYLFFFFPPRMWVREDKKGQEKMKHPKDFQEQNYLKLTLCITVI